jgi:hypothetical protein
MSETETTQARATLEHARRLGYCARGMRRWFAGREYGWQAFVTDGVPVSWLRATGDAMAEAVADEAEREETGSRNS